VALGEDLTFTIHGEVGDVYYTYLSFGTSELEWPPYGTFLLDFAQGFYRVLLGNLAGQQVDFAIPLPDDPGLSGVTFYLQSFVGPPGGLKLTDLMTVAIP
jgi:hypothetical protein